MTRALYSNHWYRLRGLKPRLRAHLQIHRHVYRGQTWYVIEDRVGGKHQRFNLGSYRVLNLLDGRRTMDEVWQLLSAELDDATPTQDEVVRLLGQLHAADLVQMDITPDVAELFERRGKQQRRKWLGRFANPVALRFPLLDPDPALRWLLRVAPPLWGRAGALLWLALVLPALVLVPAHWRELSENFNERLLADGNLWLLALLFPLVKVVHEFAHGLACRRRGGEVHEMGVMLLALYPVPYVDCSAASAFGSKWQRALVGAAGMLAELVLAALAFYLWLLLEPGLARSLAWNVAVLASVTSLFFNANPLLRYDGYYILADLIEIPNLGQRANKYWQYLAERYVFGVRNPQPPVATPGERRWFIGYGPLAYVYRLLVAFWIAIFVAQQFFVVGVLIALWSIAVGVVWPVFKGLRALATAPQFADRGPRVRAVLAGGALVLLLALFGLPLPYHTQAEGVLWLPERAILRAQADGFARTLLVAPGAQLQAQQPVLQSVAPELATRLEVQAARVAEAQVQLDAAWASAPARAQQLEQQLAAEQAALQRLSAEAEGLVLRSASAGTLLIDRPEDLPGRWLRKGDIVGYVHSDDPPVVRLVVTQAEVDAVRLDTRAVEVRLAQDLAGPWPAQLQRSVPAAARSLPSPALGSKGGGQLVTQPGDEAGMTTLEPLFEFELELPAAVSPRFLGSRVHVRFDHRPQPLAWRLGRGLRRLFLSQFQL